MIVSCYAYRIGNMEQYFENGIKENSVKVNEVQDPRLPVTSNACVGQVSRHHVNFSGFSNAIFIIGDDPVSKKWLSDHARELRQLHALGFITNINHPEVLNELQTQSGLPLLPANVDDLMSLIGTDHYPLVLNKGVVWQ
jgi:integrating conjugative element protein (TIGR03765 family)